MEKRRAVFLDRDGVINALIYHSDHGIVDSPFTVRQFSVLPRVPQAIRLLNDLGFRVVVTSNQPGIAKRHFEGDLLEKFENKLRRALASAGARIDAVYYCLHHPDASVKKYRMHCNCRKPAAGMLFQAADDLGLSLRDSYMIGDGLTDIEAGNAAGCQTIFIGRWKCEYERFIRPADLRPSFVVKDLWEAASLIESKVLNERMPADAPAQAPSLVHLAYD